LLNELDEDDELDLLELSEDLELEEDE